MKTYKTIVEDSAYNQHEFEVQATDKPNAIEQAKLKLAGKLFDQGISYDSSTFDVLVCVEMLTKDEVDEFYLNGLSISELKPNDKFRFNGIIYIVDTPFESEDKPLKTQCGQAFSIPDVVVYYLGVDSE